jgi:protein TonB
MTTAALVAILVLASASVGRAAGRDAATAGNARSSGQRADAAAREAYVLSVDEQLRRNLFYPAAAREHRLTGVVVVRLVLNADGGVVRANVARSSGHAVLDEAGISSVLRAAPFSHVPSGLPSPITFEVPIRFGISEHRPAPVPPPCRQGGARGTVRSCR